MMRRFSDMVRCTARRALLAASVAIFMPGLAWSATPSQIPGQFEEDIFESAHLLRINIEIPEDGIQTLRRSQPSRNQWTKPKTRATVREGGRTYSNVSVQLKGFSSFQPIDAFPGLTLHFSKFVPGQRFHGRSKISLNNSSQDPTRLHEKLSRELFAAAGVPVPRSDFALVSLNGRDLGLYVLAEGYDRLFLKRFFERTDGNLYDGGVLQDIDGALHVSSGKNPADHSGLQKLIRAAREPDPEKRFQALQATLDLDRFLSMVAMETLLCHSDSYSMNRNNYRLYHDPTTDKIIFMPHGMDRVLGTHRSSLDLSLVPPMLGLVARATLSTSEGRRRYLERAGVLFTNVFQPERLCRRVREVAAKSADANTVRSHGRWIEGGLFPQHHGQSVDFLCERIATRAADLRAQFTQWPELLAPTPTPQFDSDGLARIDTWTLRRKPRRPDVELERVNRDGTAVWHLRAPQAPIVATLHNRMSLPAGTYALAGRFDVLGEGTEVSGNYISAMILRYSTSRFGPMPQGLDWRSVHFSFRVHESNAPEEIELICEMRINAREIWIDSNSLQLIRQ